MILEATVPPVNHLGETVCLIVATHVTELRFTKSVESDAFTAWE